VEASLLPSEEVAELAKQVILGLARTDDPACEEFRREFDIPFFNSWVVVLDARGETLASGFGSAGHCNEDGLAKFAANMVALIQQRLRVGESLQELERRWRQAPADLDAFDNYAKRLRQMYAFATLQRVCASQAGNRALGEELRNEFRIREYLARGLAPGRQLHTEKGHLRFAREGERLLVELASHPRAADLPGALFRTVYAHGFDVPTRTAEAISRLERAARELPDPRCLNKHLRQLRRLVRDWTTDMKEQLRKAENDLLKQFLAADLGDAKAAIALFSQPGYNEVPEYQECLRAARRKLRQFGEKGRG
jgi:hypothetical protein